MEVWGGDADRGGNERNGILTSTQQTSDKLFPDPPCSSGLHFPVASIQPQTTLPPWSHPPLGPTSLLGPIEPGLVLSKSYLGFLCGSIGCGGGALAPATGASPGIAQREKLHRSWLPQTWESPSQAPH